MAIISGKDTFWTAKRGIVQNGLVLHFDCAVTPIINNTLINLAGSNLMDLTNTIVNPENGGYLNFLTDNFANIFDTTDTYLFSSSASICAWVYADYLGQGQSLIIIGKARHSNTLAGPIWSLAVFGAGSGATSPQITAAGATAALSSFSYQQWQHICATWAGGTTSLYKNGSFLTSAPTSFSSQEQSGRPLILGSVYGWNGFPYRLPSLQIYNRALSASEIAQNFNATRKRFGI